MIVAVAAVDVGDCCVVVVAAVGSDAQCGLYCCCCDSVDAAAAAVVTYRWRCRCCRSYRSVTLTGCDENVDANADLQRYNDWDPDCQKSADNVD